MKYLTTANATVLFIAVIAISFVSHYVRVSVCSSEVSGDLCDEISVFIRDVSYIVGFLLLPHLLTLPLPALVFERWKGFALWAVPLVTILILWVGMTGSSGSGIGQFHPGIIFFPLIYAFYFATSLVIILTAWYESKTSRKPQWWQYIMGFIALVALLIFGLFALVAALL
jgi:hypothetical protein